MEMDTQLVHSASSMQQQHARNGNASVVAIQRDDEYRERMLKSKQIAVQQLSLFESFFVYFLQLM